MTHFAPVEMITIAASRALSDGDVCFAGVGPPSEACNPARLIHAQNITLIYASGTIGAWPLVLPLSVGDGELCESALASVSVVEMFRYWLQGGRIPIGVLGAAHIDRFGNINTMVVGDYGHPNVRLPGGWGAPEIASFCDQVFIIVGQSKRGFVEKLDFLTTYGHGRGGTARQEMGFTAKGPTFLFADLAIWQPEPETREFTVVSLHAGISRGQTAETVGWEIRYAEHVDETPVPSVEELAVLRELHARTEAAHREHGIRERADG